VVEFVADGRVDGAWSGSTLYILGELSGHNVVLAGLPGSQGKGAAAAVAKDMACTFPSIELRLMVGIGGGVPSKKNDIRLGDVVVSMPDGQHGGVIQCDLGQEHGGRLHHEGIPLAVARHFEKCGGHYAVRPLGFQKQNP
jgi:nucleoside phosphorylase